MTVTTRTSITPTSSASRARPTRRRTFIQRLSASTETARWSLTSIPPTLPAGTRTSTSFSRTRARLSSGKSMCATSQPPRPPASAMTTGASTSASPKRAPPSTASPAISPPVSTTSWIRASTACSSCLFTTSSQWTRRLPLPQTATGATIRRTTTPPRAPIPPTPMTATSESGNSSR